MYDYIQVFSIGVYTIACCYKVHAQKGMAASQPACFNIIDGDTANTKAEID